jgi:hypothetical protein
MSVRALFESSQLARAQHSRRSAEIELDAVQATGAEADAARQLAKTLLDSSAEAASGGRVDEAWHFLHDARRAMTTLRPSDWPNIATTLCIEARKLSKWRRKAVEALIENPCAGTHSALVEALRIRDDAYETRYHRIRLLRGQLRLLLIVSILALLAAVALITTSTEALPQWAPWSSRMVMLTLSFGILGACVSSTRSVTTSAVETHIPELVASGTIAAARIVLGAVPGLVAYVFLQAGLLTVGSGPGGALTVAFVGGFSERLIVRVAESIGGGDKAEKGEN